MKMAKASQAGPVPNTADEAQAEIARLRAEVDRLNLIISRLSVEGQDAVEM